MLNKVVSTEKTEDITDNHIEQVKQLGSNGDICKEFGHNWTYMFADWRQCRVCCIQEQRKITWEKKNCCTPKW